MRSRYRFRVSSLLSLLAAVAATAVLGAYVKYWIDVHEGNTARMLFFVVMLLLPIMAVAAAALIDGVGQPILITGACVSFALIELFEIIALRDGMAIASWLTVGAGLALLADAALSIERSMPITRVLIGAGVGVVLGATYLTVAGLLEARLAPG